MWMAPNQKLKKRTNNYPNISHYLLQINNISHFEKKKFNENSKKKNFFFVLGSLLFGGIH